jgi:hypothetical protein
MYKSGFAGAHVPMKCDHFTVAYHLPKPGGSILDII